MYTPHFQKDVPNLFTDFEERMKGTAVCCYAFSIKVVLLESCRFPCPTTREQHMEKQGVITMRYTHDVIISTVKSVSGFVVDVLKFGPL